MAGKSFQDITEPDVRYVRAFGEAHADCMADAFEYDGQQLTRDIIREILAATDAEMANPAAGTISRVKTDMSLRETRTGQHDPTGSATIVELSRRINRARADALSSAENNLTVRMHRTKKAKQDQRPAQGVANRTRIKHAATVINVLIASPSDVSAERDVVTNAIYEWNAANYKNKGIMLNPLRWETHSYPSSGDRPQAIINRQITSEGDFLIGIFGNRIGTPTGKAASGTIEEIEEFRAAGKLVALYFSSAPVPRDADRSQLEAVEKYQQERQHDTLYATFGSLEELQQRVAHHLPMIVSEVYKQLQSSRELDSVEEELRESKRESEHLLSDLIAQAEQPRPITPASIGQEILRRLLLDFQNRKLGLTQLRNGYEGVSIKSLRDQVCELGRGIEVDFDISLEDLEKRGLVRTGPVVPHENDPDSGVLIMSVYSKREYASLTEKGYKAARA